MGLVITDLTYRAEKKIQNALLSCKANAFILAKKILENKDAFYQTLPKQIKSYSGTSYAELILKRTQEDIEFLAKVGHDSSIKHLAGKRTAEDCLANLKLEANEFAVIGAGQKAYFSTRRPSKETGNCLCT